jgi:hypothetical protein
MADAQCMMIGATLEIVPPTRLAPVARAAALRRWNWTGAWRSRTSRWRASSSGTIGTPSVPSANCAAGDHERAIECQETGCRQRDSWLPHLGLIRGFKPPYPDPRFQDLLRHLGLPQQALRTGLGRLRRSDV